MQSVNSNDKIDVFHKTFGAMGTRMDIVIPFVNALHGEKVYEEIRHITYKIENCLSKYNSESEVYIINKFACKSPVKVTSLVFEAFRLALHYWKNTGGLFDITCSHIIEKIKKSDNKDIDLDDCFGCQYVMLNEKTQQIFFNNRNVQVDFGGFGKGFALQKINVILQENNIENALISFGESSVLACGSHPFGEYWPIGIRNAFNEKEIIAELQLVNQSMSTSGLLHGNANKEWHIFNPVSKQIVKGNVSATITSSNPLDAEVLSTAIISSTENYYNKIENSKFEPFTGKIIEYASGSDYKIENFGSDINS